VNLELVATIITVSGLLVTVIYTPGKFDIWDLLIALLVFYVCYAFRKDLQRDPRAFTISRVGISLATTIILITLVTIVDPPLGEAIEAFKVSIIDGEFLLTLAIFLMSFIFYQRKA
jgi:hypothetical protein